MSVAVVLTKAELDRAALGTIGAGQRLASPAGASFTVYVPEAMGESERNQVASMASSVVPVSGLKDAAGPEMMLDQLAAVFNDPMPETVLLNHGTYEQEIAPRLAYRLGGSCVTDALSVEQGEQGLQVTRATFGGKAVAAFALETRPAVLTVRGRSQEAAVERDASGTIEPTISGIDRDPRVELVERHRETVDGVRLEDAAVVVSGGRGLGAAEPFERLKALAVPMKAEMAASRAACDLGWVPHSWQVGQTGKKIAPELYLAIALSGSSQHLMGIADAKQIAAINTDPDAPIFKHCRFGIVEDYDNVVDLLREKLIAKLS